MDSSFRANKIPFVSFDRAMYADTGMANKKTLQRWEDIILDEIEEPSLRTLPWTNRSERLESRLNHIRAALIMKGVPQS